MRDILSNEAIVSLIQERIQKNDTEERQQKDLLSLLYSRVDRIAVRLAIKYQHFAEYDDLVQESYIIMAESAKDYDPEKGLPFYVFYRKRLEWHFLKLALSSYGLSLSLPDMELYRRLTGIQARYYMVHGKYPSYGDLAAITGNSPDRIQRVLNACRVLSLDDALGDDTEGLTVSDTVSDGIDYTELAINPVQDEARQRACQKLLNVLPEQQRQVIRLIIMQCHTVKETAEILHISVLEVQAEYKKAIRELQRAKHIRKLRESLEDDDLLPVSLYYSGSLGFFKHNGSIQEYLSTRNLTE